MPGNSQFAILGLFVAWLLNNGARTYQRNSVMQQRLAGIKVGDVMSTDPITIPPWTSLEEVATQYLIGGRSRAVPVARDQVLLGLIVASDVDKVPQKERANRTAGEVMTNASSLIIVSPSDPVEAAIGYMAQRHLNQLPVVEDGKLIGMIDRASILDLAESAGRRR